MLLIDHYHEEVPQMLTPLTSDLSIDIRDEANNAPDSADEEENLLNSEPKPEISKRNAQRAAFNKFLQNVTDQEEIKNAAARTTNRNDTDESKRIIDRARDYQQELFERAKAENVIAVLDTGSGKTLISCLLIKHTLTQELIDRSNGRPPRVVFFLANSVHLVLQQARVLNNNLITKVRVFVGSSKAEEWKNREFWHKFFDENTPVACTPAIFQQCLDLGVLTIEQVSLMVYDEAHHAKKNHPYSRIIRSYYLHCPLESRPRIFGMTASPVDSKGNIDTNATNLEQLLHSRIVTTSDMSILSFAPKPQDVILNYRRAHMSFETDLYLRLRDLSYFASETKKGFEFAKKAVTELGPWCADRVWRYVFGETDHESASLVKRYEQSESYVQLQSVQEREHALQMLQEATLVATQHKFESPELNCNHLSPKVSSLYEAVRSKFSENPNTRAIVFVDQRLTAHVLHDCFKELDIPNVRPGILLGSASESLSTKRQEEVLEMFRAGLTNLIFATSVADEGIDIPQCNLCIRFDLYKTPIQYMQSRGRARLQGSTYIHMVQEDDAAQAHMVKYAMESDKYIKDFCQSLPPDRLLGQGTKLQRLINQDSANKRFKTRAGAVCDFGNALLILSRFASSLHHVGALDKEVYEEEIDTENKQFRFVVKLPPNDEVEVRGARGDWRQNKQLAKRSAAFNCCYLLRRKGMLDDSLYSIHRKVKPENLNAHLAVTDKQSGYPMITKPSIWSRGLGQAPECLWANFLYFEPETPLKRPLHPLLLLTREQLPPFPQFPLFLEENNRTIVKMTKIEQPLQITEEEIDALTIFTLDGVFRDVFNKTYEPDPSKMSYWLAPLLKIKPISPSTLKDLVDMDSVEALKLGRLKWSADAPVEELWTNKFICDPRNGKYHYFSGSIAPGVSIFDPVPDSVPRISGKSRNNIIDFSDSFWKASKKNFAAMNYDPSQPVMFAELLMTRRNFLDPSSNAESAQIMCQIAPQPLELSRLQPNMAASCFVLPAIIHRLESYMITLEAFEKLGLHDIPADLTLEAFTKDNDATDENENQNHFSGQRGMGKNYERLEFIGDSFLKMMTTITVFNRTKCDEEGMHCRRMEILCNRRLFDVSTQKHHLYQYARTGGFNRLTWYPENLVLLAGRGVKSPPEPVQHPKIQQMLGMKTIADISEAIIGAAVCVDNPRINSIDLGIRAITTLVDSEDHNINTWAEIAPMYEAPKWSTLMNDVQANKLALDIESRIGYKFKHPRLLRSAFTHSSDTNATVPDLQRLEFLGDAALDWVSIYWLFTNNPDRNPQWLTEHKMAMVSNKFLAALAVHLDFDKFIYCTTTQLYSDITQYATKVRESLAKPKDFISRDFWTHLDSPPKALSDLVESCIGAILVDSNWNLDEVTKFFTNHVIWFFEDISIYDTYANHHPTSFLYKKFHDVFHCRNFIIDNSDAIPVGTNNMEFKVIAGVMIHGKLRAKAAASSARYAKVKASQLALEMVEGWDVEEFRRRFGCDCLVKE